jgi:two-component system cell cycle sensor histidine kinase/response regulator CckA
MAAAPSRPPRVLVVDDEDSIRTFAERVLSDAAYQVTLASDGAEALRLAKEKGPFDLFVIDLNMPSMAGDEVARHLRAGNPDAKVLYFTGYSDRLFQEKAVLWEHEAFVEKPATMRGLLEAVSLMLFGHTRGPDVLP